MSDKMYIIHLEDLESCVVECSRFTLEAEVFLLMLYKLFAIGGKCVKFWFILSVNTGLNALAHNGDNILSKMKDIGGLRNIYIKEY